MSNRIVAIDSKTTLHLAKAKANTYSSIIKRLQNLPLCDIQRYNKFRRMALLEPKIHLVKIECENN